MQFWGARPETPLPLSHSVLLSLPPLLYTLPLLFPVHSFQLPHLPLHRFLLSPLLYPLNSSSPPSFSTSHLALILSLHFFSFQLLPFCSVGLPPALFHSILVLTTSYPSSTFYPLKLLPTISSTFYCRFYRPFPSSTSFSRRYYVTTTTFLSPSGYFLDSLTLTALIFTLFLSTPIPTEPRPQPPKFDLRAECVVRFTLSQPFLTPNPLTINLSLSLVLTTSPPSVTISNPTSPTTGTPFTYHVRAPPVACRSFREGGVRGICVRYPPHSVLEFGQFGPFAVTNTASTFPFAPCSRPTIRPPFLPLLLDLLIISISSPLSPQIQIPTSHPYSQPPILRPQPHSPLFTPYLRLIPHRSLPTYLHPHNPTTSPLNPQLPPLPPNSTITSPPPPPLPLPLIPTSTPSIPPPLPPYPTPSSHHTLPYPLLSNPYPRLNPSYFHPSTPTPHPTSKSHLPPPYPYLLPYPLSPTSSHPPRPLKSHLPLLTPYSTSHLPPSLPPKCSSLNLAISPNFTPTSTPTHHPHPLPRGHLPPPYPLSPPLPLALIPPSSTPHPTPHPPLQEPPPPSLPPISPYPSLNPPHFHPHPPPTSKSHLHPSLPLIFLPYPSRLIPTNLHPPPLPPPSTPTPTPPPTSKSHPPVERKRSRR
ncbi:hypothetical protein C7M84_005554 [Penaeus vannamei]|uniref:Uncharacterized protein n=1 Tax=Penaeus vannamei TaxID=6689 RepID=A0A3R7PSQ6_PENVA|nr:hypothetical protein C7M84_005554 [Penaeus vannamei]